MEWWDARLLLDAKAYAGADGTIAGNVNEAKITIYVEHPVPIEPPAEGPPPAPMPLMLTARVRTSGFLLLPEAVESLQIVDEARHVSCEAPGASTAARGWPFARAHADF